MLQLLTKELRSIDLLALLIGVRYQPEIAYTMYSSFSVQLFPGGAGQRHFEGSSVISKIFTVSLTLLQLKRLTF